jgi:hypothetical protein
MCDVGTGDQLNRFAIFDGSRKYLGIETRRLSIACQYLLQYAIMLSMTMTLIIQRSLS